MIMLKHDNISDDKNNLSTIIIVAKIRTQTTKLLRLAKKIKKEYKPQKQLYCSCFLNGEKLYPKNFTHFNV